MGGKVIFMSPCLFRMENPQCNIGVHVNDFTVHG
jgi:hypothetical protein